MSVCVCVCGGEAGWSNCCENDLPQLAGLTALSEAVLGLPKGYITPVQRARYATLAESLVALPTTADGSQYAPAWVVSSGTHNAEVPELYGVHPFRCARAMFELIHIV